MTAIVGPASALLCIPTESWKPYGWTHFYLNGTDEDHWPSQVTARHTGPAFCSEFNRSTLRLCPAGGSEGLRARLLLNPDAVFNIPMFDGGYSHVLHGCSPKIDYHTPDSLAMESWVMSPKLDVMDMLLDLTNSHNIAKTHATGRNRRLRDYIDGGYLISASKVVVGRTVCGPPRIVNESTKALPFPVLSADHRWRNLSHNTFVQGQWGPLLDHDVEGLYSYKVMSATKYTQARTKWVNLGPSYGAVTTGVAVISQNPYIVVARGCTLDYRWAMGQTFQSPNEFNAFEAQIGEPTYPTDSRNSYQRQILDFSDPQTLPYLGSTVKADEDWLDAAFPLHVLTPDPNGYNMTTLEAVLDGTTAAFPRYAVSDDIKRSFGHLTHTEYVSPEFAFTQSPA